MFRGVVASIPQVLAGDAVINGDELVPFFNPSSQLIEQAEGKFNQLTNGYEFRVRYSFLTTWMRYYKVLPFAIILVIPGVAYAAYLVVSWLLAAALPMFSRKTIYTVTAGPVGVMFLILTYAKITHFYTLILGFSLFTIAAALTTYGLIFAQARPYRPIVAACLITLLNPAVHYLILFAIYLGLTVVALVGMEAWAFIQGGGLGRAGRAGLGYARRLGRRRRDAAPMPRAATRLLNRLRGRWPAWSRLTVVRCGLAFVLLGVVTLFPYAMFVKFIALRGVPNLAETVPGDFYFITDASISLGHVLAFDMAGIMDKMITGDYLAKTPRYPNIVYSALLLLPLLPAVRRRVFDTRPRRQFLAVAYLNVFFSMWATLGYSEPAWLPTFHRALAFVSLQAYGMQSAIGDLVLRLTSTIVQVLRFPHRFQLIVFMMACILIPISLAWLVKGVSKASGGWKPQQPLQSLPAQAGVSQRRLTWRRLQRLPVARWLRHAVAPLLAVACLVPLAASPQYRQVFLSGNFRDFLAPYPVTSLQQVKSLLLSRPPGKVVVLPPTETAKVIVDASGVEHKFIDKFHIYYLDLPSYYYGLTGDSDNKYEFFLLLRALYYQQDWWLNIARDLDLCYIVVNKELVANTTGGAEYLREIEKILLPELDRLTDYLTKLYENESYAVYELHDPPNPERTPLFLNLPWGNFIRTLSRRLDLTRCYDLRHAVVSDDLVGYETLDLLTDDPQLAALDLWLKANPKQFFGPSSNIFAFNPDVIPSSYYLSPMFRLFQFFSDSKWNRLNLITPGLYGTIRGSFIGVPRATQFRIEAKFPQEGRYRVLLRGAATDNLLRVQAKKAGYEVEVELRSPAGALGFYDQRTVFTPGRRPLDISQYTRAELGRLMPGEIVGINLRNVYFDLGTVEARAGAQTFFFDKQDDNPLLVEGIAIVPEEAYENLTLPANVRLIDSADALSCPDEP